MRTHRPFLLLAALLFCTSLPGADPAKDKPKPGGEKDYSAELPRIPPREPAEAVKSFKLRPGFRIELVASEPLIRSPVALDFDEDGRLFVFEFPEYNQYAAKAGNARGRVRLLEDTACHGRF